MTKIVLIIEKTENGFSAYSEKYPVFTTGKTISELIINANEACSLYFNEEPFIIEHIER